VGVIGSPIFNAVVDEFPIVIELVPLVPTLIVAPNMVFVVVDVFPIATVPVCDAVLFIFVFPFPDVFRFKFEPISVLVVDTEPILTVFGTELELAILTSPAYAVPVPTLKSPLHNGLPVRILTFAVLLAIVPMLQIPSFADRLSVLVCVKTADPMLISAVLDAKVLAAVRIA